MIEWITELLLDPGAASKILIFVAGLLVAWIGNMITDRQGNRVEISRISHTFHFSLKNGNSLDQVFENNFRIKNKGKITINELFLDFSIKLDPSSSDNARILNLELYDPSDLAEAKLYYAASSETKIEGIYVIREYIKPYRKYSEEVLELKVVSDRRINFSVNGSGDNWHSKYKDKVVQLTRSSLLGFILFEALLIISLTVLYLLTFTK